MVVVEHQVQGAVFGTRAHLSVEQLGSDQQHVVARVEHKDGKQSEVVITLNKQEAKAIATALNTWR